MSPLCWSSPPPRSLDLSHPVPRPGLPLPGEGAWMAAGTQEAVGSWPGGPCPHGHAGSPARRRPLTSPG